MLLGVGGCRNFRPLSGGIPDIFIPRDGLRFGGLGFGRAG